MTLTELYDHCPSVKDDDLDKARILIFADNKDTGLTCKLTLEQLAKLVKEVTI